MTLDHLLDPRQGICHHHLQVQDLLLRDAQGHGGGGHPHLHHDVPPHQQHNKIFFTSCQEERHKVDGLQVAAELWDSREYSTSTTF